MRIAGISTHVVNADLRNWVFVRVETDEPGLYGWGEATLEWKTRAVVGAVADLEPLIVGKDPRDIEHLVRTLSRHGFWRTYSSVAFAAASACARDLSRMFVTRSLAEERARSGCGTSTTRTAPTLPSASITNSSFAMPFTLALITAAV